MKKEIESLQAELALLRAEMELPAGTTCYLADIHGQGNKFFHIINNKAGSMRRKLEQVLPEMDETNTVELLKLCYYPEEYLERHSPNRKQCEDFITALAKLVSHTGSKMTRSDFSEAVESSTFPEVLSELVTNSNQDKIGSRTGPYRKKLIRSLIDHGIHLKVILDLTTMLRSRLVHKYIINGDIPDRGRDTAKILDHIISDPGIHINWGNHDLLWMGAAAGSRELICDLVRIQLRYGHSGLLEEDYGIPLQSLSLFAMRTYQEQPAQGFYPGDDSVDERYNREELARMQKAIAVILWKLEATVDPQSPLLSMSRDSDGMLYTEISGKHHPLVDQDLPTVIDETPCRLSNDEEALLKELVCSFKNSTRLQRQMRHLAINGSLFRLQDGILSFHAIVPVDCDGQLADIEVLGKKYRGRALFETLEGIYRASFAMQDPPEAFLKLFYRGWKGADSWTFGKNAMRTFSRMMIADPETHREEKSCYYTCLADPLKCGPMVDRILRDFTSPHLPAPERIYNGHIPVKLEKNDEPVRADGRVICGDGGFSEAYGDIGFVFVTTSRGMYLSKLGSGIEVSEVMEGGADILPQVIWNSQYKKRLRLKQCNSGKHLQNRDDALVRRIREAEEY